MHSLSPKASQLHRSVLESFNESDRSKFTQILAQYQRNKNVQRLVESLQLICTTLQQKEEIYPLIRGFIPHKHREKFDYEYRRPKTAYGRHYATYSRKKTPDYGYYTTRSLPSDTRNRVSGSSLGFKRESRTSFAPVSIESRHRISRSSLGIQREARTPSLMDPLNQQKGTSLRRETPASQGERNSVSPNPQSKSTLNTERTPTPNPRIDECDTTSKSTRERKESNSRMVVLEREIEGESFGFCIRGGSEYNIGLFVSSVDEGSVAHNAGICLGDQILEVNRVDFRSVSHREAVQVIQEAPVLHMLVKSVGKIPGSFKSSESYRWIDPSGNEVSPPTQYESMMNGDKSEMRLLGADDERKVNLFVADGAEIGLKIRGGMEHGLGIFIASVERNSGADRAGIQVGDQILDVNGKSFLNISHAEAVKVLKSSQQLVIMLKDIGILPHGKRVYDETRWLSHTEINNSPRSSTSANSNDKRSKSMKKTPSFHDPMGSSQLTHHSVLDHSDEILEMKAHQLLPSDEQYAFAFYLNEYRTTRLSLTSFLAVLSELLSTPEKGSLFQEIRSAILPRDLTKFDEWIKKTAHTRLWSHVTDSKQARHDRVSLNSYRSSDSSTNSWLGLFENGNEQRTGTKLKFRSKLDALPHPPEDFLDETSDTRGIGSIARNTPCNSSFDDFPPPFVCDLNTERTGFEDFPYDDGLYAAVDYKGSNRTAGNLTAKNAVDDQGIEDGLYSSVDETGRKSKDTTRISMNNMKSDVEHRLYSPVKNNSSTKNSFPEKNKDLKRFSTHNGFKENEQDSIPVYAKVNKSDIRFKKTRQSFLEENDFEIPPPIPDRLYLESEFSESIEGNVDSHLDENRESLPNSVTTGHKDAFAKSATDYSRDGIETSAIVETITVSSPERLQKFNAKPSVGESNAENVQKVKRGKKKSRSNLVQTEDLVDYTQPFVVELTKHCSNLGLSVAGGTDTDCKEIRIKSIKNEDTVAGSCPLLQPGQIILGVDEKSLQNVTSGIAAMAIRQAFNSDKTVLKLILRNDI